MKYCQQCGRQVERLVVRQYTKSIGPGAFACCRSELCQACTAAAENEEQNQGLKGRPWATKQEEKNAIPD